jgi:hypothetical protein
MNFINKIVKRSLHD